MASRSEARAQTRGIATVTVAFGVILLISCLAVLGLAWISLSRSRAHYQERAETAAQNLCTVLADNLSTSYEKIDLAVLEAKDELERQLASGRLNPPRLEACIRTLRHRVPVLHALRTVNADGIVEHGDLPPGPPVSLADRAYFQRLKTDPSAGLVFSKPLQGRVTAIWTVMLARRIDRPDGSFGGIVYGSIDLDKLGARFASLSIGKEGIIELRDVDLEPIVGHGKARSRTERSALLPILGELQAKRAAPLTYTSTANNGAEHIYASSRLQPYGQYLSVGLGSREVFEPWRRELHQVLGFVLTFLLLVGASAGMAYRAWLRHQSDSERISNREILLAEANTRLLDLNHQKDHFLRIVAHDLRNPLSGIVLATELLEEEIELGQVGGIVRSIRRESMEMQSLIERFLDIARIDSGDIKPEPEQMELVALAHQIAASHQAKNHPKNISFEVQCPASEVDIHADPRFVREVLDNLVSNAAKFSPSGSTVTMRIEAGQREVVFSVEDQGPGLSSEDRAKAFGRFVTLSARPTAGEKSTGLGLNIVKHLVDAMGGRIWIDSVPGQGAAFRVALPRGTSDLG